MQVLFRCHFFDIMCEVVIRVNRVNSVAITCSKYSENSVGNI